MKEILITSSALIAAVLVIRLLFRQVLSRRVQYALWGLVLLRLLVPVSLPAAEFSLLSAAAPVEQVIAQRWNGRPYYFRSQGQVSPAELEAKNILASDVPTAEERRAMINVAAPADTNAALSRQEYLVRDPETGTVTRYAAMTVGPWALLRVVWIAGMAIAGGWLLAGNLRLYAKLRRRRRAVKPESRALYARQLRDMGGPELRRRVYLVDDGVVPSPCLFGLFSPAIYLTPAALRTEDALCHVLAHEETHARHLDPLWSLLRCVCITVYWFNPLVWIAAACAKTDCELACDESVLKRLGESQRIAYGQTLLSLIPVRRVSNPLLSATTMTAGKRQLKDRITRIARNPRQAAAAALAAAVLSLIVCACTFTGAKPTGTPGPAVETGAPSGSAALAGEELEWFNKSFFNSSGIGQNQLHGESESYFNIRNQFANPAILYDAPEDIDLFELFYCSGSSPTDKELRSILDVDPDELDCPAYKITSDEMDAVLTQYTGTTLEQSSQVGVDRFPYKESGGAYYWMHGDTNYCGKLNFLYGTRENTGDGRLVKLYHSSSYAGNSWYCVTLAEQGEGMYWFVSNRQCGHPAIPPVPPSLDPAAAISLKDLEPYTAEPVTVERHEGDFVFSYENNIQNWNIDGRHLRVYRAANGAVYAAVEQDGGAMDVFARFSCDDVDMFFFHGLFGRDGFTITYQPGANARFYSTNTDYYYFDDNGTPVLLARCYGDSQIVDLDGDGTDELIAPRQMFFRRDGLVYEARLDQLLLAACPELSNWDYESWNVYGRRLYVNGLTDWDSETGAAMWERYLCFDGQSILVYRPEKATTDHIVEGIDAGVLAQVAEQAKAYVESILTLQADGTWLHKDWEEYNGYGYVIDDWRVESFHGPYTYTFGEACVEGWGFNYELHTPEPEKVTWAGGLYVTEDGWVSPGYPGCDYLFFRRGTDGKLTFLWKDFYQENMDSHYVNESVFRRMEEHGIELGSTTYAAVQFESDLDYLLDFGGGQIILSFTASAGGGGTCVADPNDGNGPYYRRQLTDPENYLWYRLDDNWIAPECDSVILAQPDWNMFIQFWLYDDVVMVKYSNREPQWYKAESLWDPADIFYYRSTAYYHVRSWYDQLELDAVRANNAAIADRQGLSQLDAAREWAQKYEGAMLRLSPGGSYTCTYVKAADVEILSDMPESWFSGEAALYPHFAFSYSTIFVPESEDVLSNLMAGNTAEYEGNASDVPEGAFQYWRTGSMYLKDGFWYCGGIGTG